MSRSPAKNRLEWSEIGVLAMLGGLVVFGFAANELSLVQSVVSLGFGAGVLAIAWLWRLSLARAETAPPPTWREMAGDAVLLVAWLIVVGGLALWCYASNRSDRTRHDAPPAAGLPNVSEDPGEDDGPAEPAPHNRGEGP